ncbi:unnamed protein product [marine sediment metagenome]|uniref:Uncharacterized protein n=1 Tax=marine sediment metagenome TaxID=412755 RepID=X1CZZ6_9ZZZZ
MKDKRGFHAAIEELALKRGDWFLARNLVNPLEKKLGKSVSSISVGKHLSKMSDRLILESRFLKNAQVDGLKEYHVIKWDPNL